MYDIFLKEYDSYEEWIKKVLDKKIFINDEEAKLYLIKFMSNDYLYLENFYKKIFNRNGYGFYKLYETELTNDITSENKKYIGSLKINNFRILMNIKKDDFSIIPEHLYYYKIIFPSLEKLSSYNIGDLINLDLGSINETSQKIIFMILKNFILMNHEAKEKVLFDITDYIFKYIVLNENKNFTMTYLNIVVLNFLEKLKNSEETILSENIRYNIESLIDKKNILENELMEFTLLYKLFFIDYKLPNFELIENLNEVKLEQFFIILNNTLFKNIVPYLRLDLYFLKNINTLNLNDSFNIIIE